MKTCPTQPNPTIHCNSCPKNCIKKIHLIANPGLFGRSFQGTRQTETPRSTITWCIHAFSCHEQVAMKRTKPLLMISVGHLSDWEDFWALQPVEILVFASPTGWLHVDIFRFPFVKIGVYVINSSKMISNFPATVLYFNRLFSQTQPIHLQLTESPPWS